MRKIQSVCYWMLASIILYLPVRTPLYIYISTRHPGSWTSLFQYLPEFLLLIGGAVVVLLRLRVLLAHKFPRLISLTLALLVLSVLTMLFRPHFIFNGFSGIWFDFEGLLALLVIWLAPPEPEQARKLLKFLLYGLLVIAAFGVSEFIFGFGLVKWLGYEPYQHFVGKIRQVRSLLPGPNPLSTMTLLLMVLVIGLVKNSKLKLGLLAIAGLIEGWTFSRSSWLGVVIFGGGLFIYMWVQNGHRIKKSLVLVGLVVIGLSSLAGATISTVRYHETLTSVITHGSSTPEHVVQTTKAVKKTAHSSFVHVLLGNGIGSAGPASYKIKDANIAESWYLQLIQEIGLLGLALYTSVLIVIISELYRRNEIVLVWLTFGLMANALFLHIWADDHYLNLAFGIIIGLVLYSGASLQLNGIDQKNGRRSKAKSAV